MFRTVLPCFCYWNSWGPLQLLYLFSFSTLSELCSLPGSKMLLFYTLRHWEINGEIFRNAQHPALICGNPRLLWKMKLHVRSKHSTPCLESQSNLSRMNQCQCAVTKYSLEAFMLRKSTKVKLVDLSKKIRTCSSRLSIWLLTVYCPRSSQAVLVVGVIWYRPILKGSLPPTWKSPRHVGASTWILLGETTTR